MDKPYCVNFVDNKKIRYLYYDCMNRTVDSNR